MLGGGPKFPHEPMIALMLAEYQTRREKRTLDWLTTTLDAMGYGALWDHLGGGFHRYSTESTWSIPHFEKMLYNNTQLLEIYADAYVATKRPFYAQVALALGDYLHVSMMDPEGGFYTALDAEVGGEEGASYVWTPDQILAVLGPSDAEGFFQIYGLTKTAPSSDGMEQGILRIRRQFADTQRQTGVTDLADVLAGTEPLRRRLLTVRNSRPQPALDAKIVVSLNGLAIGALARSSVHLQKPELVDWALRAAERIWAQGYTADKGMLVHEIYGGKAQTPGFLADYASLGLGFMALYETTRDAKWQRRAVEIADALLKRFARTDGSLATSQQEKELPLAPADTDDSTVPSGTSAAIDLFLRLAATPENARYVSALGRILRRMGSRIERQPESWPSLLAAAHRSPNVVEAALAETAGQSIALRPVQELVKKPLAPDTANHVHASAAAKRGLDSDLVTVTLNIDRGYHVNANPASLDYLIPTTVEFDRLSPTEVVYPKADRFRPAFTDGDLDVYQGAVILIARFATGTILDGTIVEGRITAQACTDSICLPPAAIPFKASTTAR